MKKTLLILFTAVFLSCNSDDKPEEAVETSTNKLQYTIDGQTYELFDMYMNDINFNGVPWGKHVGAFADAPAEGEGYRKVDFYFDVTTNPGIFDLYGVEFLVWDPPHDGILTGTGYTNYIFDETLPFEHTITNQNGRLKGEFNGKVVWPTVDTLDVSGSFDFELTAE